MFCNHGYHSIGFLAGAPHNISYQSLFNNVKQFLDESRYESVGSAFYNVSVNMTTNDVYNLSMSVVYPQNYAYAESMFLEPAINKIPYIKDNTIGWHWYAGHPTCGDFQNKYTKETYNNFDNIITYLIDK